MLKRILIFVFIVCCVCWLYEMGSLIFTENYQMTWFNQLLSAFTSALAMVTWIFEEMEN